MTAPPGSTTSRHRRVLGARVGAVVGIVGVAAAMLVGLLALVDESAVENDHALEASRALASLYRLNSLESTAEAGEEVTPAETDDAIVELATQVVAAAKRLGDEEAGALVADTAAYAAAVRETVDTYRSLAAGSGSSEEAEAFDREVTDPVYTSLEGRLADLSEDAHRASADASASTRTGIVVLLGLSIVAVLGFAAWLVRSDRRAAARRSRARADARFRSLVEASSDQIYLVGADGTVRYASPAAERAWRSMVPSDVDGLVSRIDGPAREAVLRAVHEGPPAEPVLAAVDGPATATRLEITGRDLRADPEVGGIVFTARDVTEQYDLQERLRQQAQEDELTGLPNRRSLNRALAGALARASRHGRQAGLVLVDLDGFKGVNDTLGHPVGDELLRQVAVRMRAACRAAETVGRLGGDEFAVILEEVATADEADRAAERFLDVLRQPYDIEGNLLAVNASLGLAIATGEHGPDDLFRHADIALYEAKQSGRNRVVAFRPDMEHLVFAAARLQRELAGALDRGELSLVYQPLCTLDTGVPVGFEALMRWHSEALGDVSPMTFIPAAERSGLIVELGRWALLTACRQLADWQVLVPGRKLTMSVNVSVLQVAEPGFVDDVRAVLAETGVTPSDLQLEVTESALADDLDRLGGRLAEIRELGVRIALDDFGTGYSSMGQLQRLPVDCIKIDRSFVAALRTGGARAKSVVDALVDLGAALGLSIVAEGIEDQEQLDAFRRDECELAQGYLLARPMPPAAALAFVRERTPVPPG